MNEVDSVEESSPAPAPGALAEETAGAVAGVGGKVEPAPQADESRRIEEGHRSEERRRAEEQSAEADAADESSWTRHLPVAVAVVLPLLFFFVLPPLSRSGLWDPYELNVADLARRVALNLFHASHLALEGTDNSLPHLNDLGRPELPFTSMALGFRLFGLHEWAGRLPLAMWGFVGVLATYGFVARLVDKRAGLYAAVALTTMPLYFVQARTMIGDVVAMSALAMAFGGLAVAVFDRDEAGPTVGVARWLWLGVGLVGLFAGFYSRGGLLGVAVPCLGVGLAFAVAWLSGAARLDGLGRVVGSVAVLVGFVAAGLAFGAYGRDRGSDLSPWLGAMIRPPGKYPTFDIMIGNIGHAAAPWSAFVPFAVGRLFLPPVRRAGALFERESVTRAALLLGAAVAVTAQGYLLARTEPFAFTGPALLAAICAVAIRDYERGAHASVAVAVGTGVFLGLLHHDFHALPEKAFQAYGVASATFPEGFKQKSLTLWWVSLGSFALLAFFTWVDRDSTRKPFDPKTYVRVLDGLRTAWDGLLVVAYYALVAGAAIAGFVAWFGTRNKWKIVALLSSQIKELVVNAWWVVALAPFVVVFGFLFLNDAFLWAFGRAGRLSSSSVTRGFEPFEDLFRLVRDKNEPAQERTLALAVLVPIMVLAVPAVVLLGLVRAGVSVPLAAAVAIPSGLAVFLLLGLFGDVVRGRRAAGMLLAGLVGGGSLAFAYYPALATQLSPKDVFDTYQHKRTAGEPLGLFGVGGRTAAYYAGGQPPAFQDAPSAYAWLTGGAPQRRFLAVRIDELGRLNQLQRGGSQPRTNLPVVDARSSQVLLVTSSLASGEVNASPFEKLIMNEPPPQSPRRKLDANLDDRLLVLGQDLTDSSGRPVDAVAAGKRYHLRTFMKVLAPLTNEWEAFVHIDGFKRRHNGDHKPLGGKLPMTLWLKDDVMVDDYEFTLEPNFLPGTYTIYFGFFIGDTRMSIRSGPNDGDNRIVGGPLRVQ